jgi:stress response protein SCP2
LGVFRDPIHGIDADALMLDGDGAVQNDSNIVFYNQERIRSEV